MSMKALFKMAARLAGPAPPTYLFPALRGALWSG
jgi:hypothetical protein